MIKIDSEFCLNYFWTLEHKGRSPYCFTGYQVGCEV